MSNKASATRKLVISQLLETSGYHTPKENDSSNGNNGKAFELVLKELANSTLTTVSRKGKVDLVKKVDGKMKKFEIKTGGGELFNVSKNGIKTGLKVDYVIYIDRFEKWEDLKKAVVFDRNAFLINLEIHKLVRPKRSSPMQKKYKKGLEWWYDKITVQSPKGRENTVSRFMATGEPIYKFWKEHNIR